MAEVTCPHCEKTFPITLTGVIHDEQRMAFKLSPKPGELICTKTLGGVTENFGKLLDAVGKDLGTETRTLVERIETTAEGEHVIHVLIVRKPKLKARKSRSSPEKGEGA